ncbi:tellurite resistance TerB family protein [Nitrosococcus watsonii]|uniref:Tellurite resistance TerB family protein n=1 Tax=Nitrosococcus watsoni (strain C-113) TaxID=105559 RepID=D8KAT3_NITWC|nr:tellurite resistance TerB family protein [Nitrosococcus watsonii]ADJ29510.1 protein of unknown function DUF533 [Nitrosococcus watsonii C-113]
MSFGNIVGQLLQNMSSQSHSRLERTTSSEGLGGLMDIAQNFLSNKQAGNMTGGQASGLGALAGALLGGGSSAATGALGGSAMAILGTLAVSALQNWQNNTPASAAGPASEAPQSLPQEQIEALAAPQTERLMIKAMITAAKADGQLDQKEMDNIFGKIGADGITDEERRLVMEELGRPMDLQALVSMVPNEAVAAQVYAASLFAIDIDTEAERAYLRQLAQALKLDGGTVSRLHELTGSPMA